MMLPPNYNPRLEFICSDSTLIFLGRSREARKQKALQARKSIRKVRYLRKSSIMVLNIIKSLRK